MRMIHSAKRLRGGRRERAPAISWLLARAAYAANVRSLIDTLIPWRGHEWLLRVDPSGSKVAPRTAGIGAKRSVQFQQHQRCRRASWQTACHRRWLKLRGDVMEGRTEVGPDQLERGDRSDCDQGSDQPVFNRSRPTSRFPIASSVW